MTADRHLLFGLLALQNDFIDKRQLLVAFGTWMADHSQSVDDILVASRALSEDDRMLLDRLVQRHIASHAGDVSASLRALKGSVEVRDELNNLADDQLHQSIAKLAPIAQATMAPSVGEQTASGRRFEIRRPLDRGGLGIVSVAIDKELNREVALKEIRGDRADEPAYRSKFLLEAEVTGGLEHPGIVPVYGFGAGSDGRPYYAMRLIRGENLHVHIKRFHELIERGDEPFDGPMLRSLLRSFLDVCQAIEYAHSRGVLHRDLKPGNVMLGRYGETLVVDWGLAKPMGSSRKTADSLPASVHDEPSLIPSGHHEGLTLHGSIVGTAGYAAPEQLTGDLERVSERSDIYGLGAILFEILANQSPAHADSLEEAMRLSISGSIAFPSKVASKMPKPLAAIAMRALATRADSRYASAAELKDEIERWLDDLPVKAFAEPFSTKAFRWIKQHRSLATGIAATMLMAIFGLGALSYLTEKNNATLNVLNGQLSEQRDLANNFKNDAITRLSIAKDAIDTSLVKLVDSLESIPGSDRLKTELLNRAAEDYKDLSSSKSDDPELERERIRALVRLADIHYLQRNLPEAYREYDEALQAIRDSQKRFESDDIRRRFRLEEGKILARIGLAKSLESSRQTEAIDDYNQAESVLRELIEQDKNNADYQRQLATVLMSKAQIIQESESSSIETAEQLLSESIALLRSLKDSSDNGDANKLASALELSGRVLRKQARYAEAQSAFDEARRLVNKQISDDANNIDLQLNLASVTISLANLKRATGSLRAAVDDLKSSQALYDRLLEQFPDDIQFRELWATNQCDLAAISIDLGEPQTAQQHGFQAVSVFDELANRFPDIHVYKIGLAASLSVLAQSLSELEPSSDEIELAYRRSLELSAVEESSGIDKNSWGLQSQLHNSTKVHYAYHLYNNANPNASMELLNDVVKTCRATIESGRHESELQDLLVYALMRRAEVSKDAGKLEMAADDLREATKLQRMRFEKLRLPERAYQLVKLLLRQKEATDFESDEADLCKSILVEGLQNNHSYGTAAAQILFMQRKLDEARSVLDRNKESYGPLTLEDHLVLAEIELAEKSIEPAKRHLEQGKNWLATNRPFCKELLKRIEEFELKLQAPKD